MNDHSCLGEIGSWDELLHPSGSGAATLFLGLAEYTNDPLLLLDLSDTLVPGKIVYANPAANKTYGYAAEEMLGRSAYSLEDAADPEASRARCERLTATEALWYETKIRRKNGSIFPVAVEIRLVEFQGKRIAIAIHRGRTEPPSAIDGERSADCEPLAHFELNHVVLLITLGQIAARITHEISQPIYAIMNYASACSEVLSRASATAKKSPFDPSHSEQEFTTEGNQTRADDAQESPQKKSPARQLLISVEGVTNVLAWLQQVSEQALRAGDVIRRLSSFTRDIPIRSVVSDPHQLMNRALDFLSAELHERDVLVDCEFDSQIELAICEPILVEQVLVNLVRNASKSMLLLSRDRRRLLIRTRRLDKQVEFAIVDSGPVIELDALNNSYESFISTKADGRVRGLAVDRAIIEAQTGRLWVENNPGQGMAVLFTLPLPSATD